MSRNLAAFFVGVVAPMAIFGYIAKSQSHGREFNADACAGEPLKTVAARNDAMAAGYSINSHYDCIDKNSYLRVSHAAQEREQLQQRINGLNQRATLAQARQGFQTKISVRTEKVAHLPTPSPTQYVRTDYKTAIAQSLPAYVTPDAGDGFKHPAIIWLTGDDPNSLGDLSAANSSDAAVKAFRDAGVVVMLPTLRGGNTDKNGKEYLFGEVDDVLAAADHLAQLSYVNPDRIFLGGHGTGGTLALLVAETNSRFAGVFSFGPISEADHYPLSIIPVNFREYDRQEKMLRSPIYWLHGVASPTYVIEGKNQPGNTKDAERICAQANSRWVQCILVDDADHATVLDKVSTVIAARVSISDSRQFAMRSDEL
jgi:dienelactone hydrolase